MALETEGYVIKEAHCGAKALDELAAGGFDLAILDMRMPEMDGLDLLAEMRNRGFTTPSVIITAYGDVPHAVRAMKLGAIDFLKKPITPEALRNIVADVVSRHQTSATASRPAARRLRQPHRDRAASAQPARFRRAQRSTSFARSS